LVGTSPFDLHNNGSSILGLAAVVLTDVLSPRAGPKGMPLVGVIGIFMPLVSLLGAVPFVSPSSVWARRRYDPGARNLARAKAWWKRLEARRQGTKDAIAGAPEAPAAAVEPILACHERTAEELGSDK
jgi:hypothetical protein